MRAFKLIAVALGMLIVFGACSLGGSSTTSVTDSGSSSSTSSSSTSSSSTSTGSTSTSSTTTSPSPTNTPTSPPAPPTCNSLLGGGAGTASAGGGFGDVPFPSGSLSTPRVLHHSATGDWTIYLMNVCTSGSSISALHSFFASQLPANGWAYAPNLPFNGHTEQSCGDPYCWSKDANPRLVGFESAVDNGGGLITYRLRLFLPPPAPSCPSYDMPGIVQHVPTEGSPGNPIESIQLPPLTHYNSGADTTPINGDIFCSAGTQATVESFMQGELTSLGWAQSSAPMTDCSSLYYDMPTPSSPQVQCWKGASGRVVLIGFFSSTGWYFLVPRGEEF